ncbi:MAG: hypothetical protein ACFFCQ_18970 [Promethearchaeota archaeon]
MTNKKKTTDETSKPMVKLSKISIFGVILLLLTLLIAVLEMEVFKIVKDYTIPDTKFVLKFENIIRFAISIEILIIALGFVVERLQVRGFEFWVLGAVVSYLGFLILFTPLMLFTLGITLEPTWFAGFVLFGGLIILSGYFVEAYDLNERFIRKALEIIEVIQKAEYRKIPGRIGSFVWEIFKVTIFYISRGIRRLRTILKHFITSIMSFIGEYLRLLLSFIRAIPRTVKRFFLLLFEAARANVYLFVLLGGIGAIITYQEEMGWFNAGVGLGSVTLFMAGLLFAYPRRERIGRLVQATQDRAWNLTWQTQNMVQRITRRKRLCEKCGATLKVTDRKCPSCDAAPERCQVCGLPITADKGIFHCPSCSSPFHEPHWQQWQRMGKGCPICRA